MNENLEAAGKFKRISLIIFATFFIISIITIPIFAFLFGNYWLLFGLAFAFLAPTLRSINFSKIFVLSTVAISIYWIIEGFNFSSNATFYWFSFLFGYISESFVKGFEDLSQKIIKNEANGISEGIINQLDHGKESRFDKE